MIDIVPSDDVLSSLEIVFRLFNGTSPLSIPALDLLAELEQMRPIYADELLQRGAEIEAGIAVQNMYYSYTSEPVLERV